MGALVRHLLFGSITSRTSLNETEKELQRIGIGVTCSADMTLEASLSSETTSARSFSFASRVATASDERSAAACRSHPASACSTCSLVSVCERKAKCNVAAVLDEDAGGEDAGGKDAGGEDADGEALAAIVGKLRSGVEIREKAAPTGVRLPGGGVRAMTFAA